MKKLLKPVFQSKNRLKNMSSKKKILLAAIGIIIIAGIAVAISFGTKKSQEKKACKRLSL